MAERFSMWKDERKSEKPQNLFQVGHASSFGNDVWAVCLCYSVVVSTSTSDFLVGLITAQRKQTDKADRERQTTDQMPILSQDSK